MCFVCFFHFFITWHHHHWSRDMTSFPSKKIEICLQLRRQYQYVHGGQVLPIEFKNTWVEGVRRVDCARFAFFRPIICETFLSIPIHINRKHKKYFWKILIFSGAPSRANDLLVITAEKYLKFEIFSILTKLSFWDRIWFHIRALQGRKWGYRWKNYGASMFRRRDISAQTLTRCKVIIIHNI